MGTKFILGQEDGTIAGGDPRGANAVDLQTSRGASNQVAVRDYTVVLGGQSNTSDGDDGRWGVVVGGLNNRQRTAYGVVVGGQSNQTGDGNAANSHIFIGGGSSNYSNGSYSVITGGRSNTTGNSYSVVSGGQSNTASTNTHATVVGGQGNVSSGRYSITGGQNCTAIDLGAVAFGINSTASAYSMAAGYFANASGGHCFAFGQTATASGGQCFATGTGVQATGTSSVAMGYYTYSSGEAAVSLGTYNRATGKASIAVGNNAAASLLGQFSVSSGTAIYNGGHVYSIMAIPLATAAVNSGGTYTFTLENGQLILPENGNGDNTVPYQMLITAKVVIGVRAKSASITTIGDNDIFMSTYNLGVRRRMSSARTIIGAPQQVNTFSDASLSTTTVNFAIGASNELLVSFTPPTWTGGGQIVFVATLSLEMTMMGMHQTPI